MRFAPRAVGALILLLALVGGSITGTVMTGAHSSDAACSVDHPAAQVGRLVTFSATGLNGGGPTALEMISGTDGDFYYKWSLGNVGSYAFTWRYLAPGTYAAVFSTDGKGAWRMKCDVYVTVS